MRDVLSLLADFFVSLCVCAALRAAEQVGEVLPSLAPSGLSDIDFLLMIDYVAAYAPAPAQRSTQHAAAATLATSAAQLTSVSRLLHCVVCSPWLGDAESFQAVHDTCRAAVERAMTNLAEDTEAAVRAVSTRRQTDRQTRTHHTTIASTRTPAPASQRAKQHHAEILIPGSIALWRCVVGCGWVWFGLVQGDPSASNFSSLLSLMPTAPRRHAEHDGADDTAGGGDVVDAEESQQQQKAEVAEASRVLSVQLKARLNEALQGLAEVKTSSCTPTSPCHTRPLVLAYAKLAYDDAIPRGATRTTQETASRSAAASYLMSLSLVRPVPVPLRYAGC
jgi:hypothetical protein